MPAADFRPTRSVVLVGLPGAGKSTVGERLATRLGLPFADSDAVIEQATRQTVGQIFERLGEAAFRTWERQAIATLLERPPAVIAAGGGAFVDDRTRRRLLDRCAVVWLDAPVEVLAARVAEAGDRPLLRVKHPMTALATLARQRTPLYTEAPIRVDAGAPVAAVVEQILAALGPAGISPVPSGRPDCPPEADCPARTSAP